MSVGGASGTGGAGAGSTSGASTSTGASTISSTTTAGTNGATATSGSATQTAQASATANGASISGQTQTGDGQAATGDPAALGQPSFTVDTDAIAALPAPEQALAMQFSIAIVRAQQEEMARAQQPAVPAGIAVTDPSMAQQAFDGLKGFVNDTRLNAVTALESFAKQLSERMQTNPEAFDDANKLLSALPSNIAINAVVGEIQAQNPADAAALKATLDSFVQRQITALEKGEASPEVAGVAAIAALVAAYKLAPKGELTAVVQSLAKPIENAFAAAKSRFGVSFDKNTLGTIGGPVRVGVTKPTNLPGWKSVQIDMGEVISGHTRKGARVQQAGDLSRKDVFPDDMTERQIERTIRQAYRRAEVLGSQTDRFDVTRIHWQGVYNGFTIEGYLNKATKTIESAWPK
jgi:hypothetical protein